MADRLCSDTAYITLNYIDWQAIDTAVECDRALPETALDALIRSVPAEWLDEE